MKRAILFVFLALSVSPGFAQESCNRECLKAFITQYLKAMVAHDPKALTLAPNTRFTENTKTLPLGEGLWKEARTPVLSAGLSRCARGTGRVARHR